MQDDPIKTAMSEFICLRVEEGLTLKQIGEELGCNAATVLRRATFCPSATQRYARARVFSADVLASHLLDVAAAATPTDAQASRLYVDTLKWDLSKRLPRVYGDRIALDHGGAVAVTNVELTPEQFEVMKAVVLKDI